MLDSPKAIVWDITYACPLRCVHCYSESGRRPAKQLDLADSLRVVDAMLALRPGAIVLSGGEPATVPHLAEVAQRIAAAGVEVHLYTSGWSFPRPEMLDLAAKITVSLDGATAEVHDRVRGRAGSFQRAMQTLAWLDSRREAYSLGIDSVVLRSTFTEMAGICELVAARFTQVDYLYFGAVLPIGLASRADFADAELPTEEQLEKLRKPDLARTLARLAPGVQVHTSDNTMFQMHPDRLAAGQIPAMQVEPDGRVRAMPVYEGTVGSLLYEDPFVLWRRAVQRWSDPMVTDLLRAADTGRRWAHAARSIDERFGTNEDRRRIASRPAYRVVTPA